MRANRDREGIDEPMAALQAVLFDGDGTLIDTEGIILTSMRYTVNELHGMEASDEELMAGVGTPLPAQMLHFAGGDEALAEQLVDEYRAHNDRIHDEAIGAFVDTREALELLRDAGHRMGVVTSKRHEMAARGLELSGIDEFFEVLVAPDDWPEHKPAPGPIRYACELMGVDPQASMYVGDSPYDIQAGNAAGCATVAALWGMFPKAVLAAEHPTMMRSSLLELARELTEGTLAP